MLIDERDDPGSRLIVALDVYSKEEARALIETLGDVVSFYKIGLQLFVAEGMPFVKEIIGMNKRVFLDLKIDDVEETITRTVREITRSSVRLLTLHGNRATARAAVLGRGESEYPRLLQVTLLSSLNENDLRDFGILGTSGKFPTLMDFVLWRAEQSIEAGCDGLIASGETISRVRERVGENKVLVCPGIRPAGAASDDHKRSSTPGAAIRAGADYLVVGRPVRDATNPRAAAEAIIEEMGSAADTHA